MTLSDLLSEFNVVIDTPEGLKELRSLILGLAVRGKLVEQDPNDEPASELLKEIEEKKKQLYEDGEIKRPNKVKKIPVDEHPFHIPNNWVWTNLNETGIINPRNDAKDDSDASFISMSLIFEGFMEMHDSEKRKWKEIKSGYTHFAENDVGLAKITPCFQNGKAAIFRNLTNGIGAGTTELYIFRSVINGLDPEYVYAFLRTPDFVNQGVEKMTGTAGQQRVPKSYFAHRPFPLPPANEQHRIVQKIESFFAEVDKLEAKLNQQTKLDEKLQVAVNAEVQQAPDAEASKSAWNFITSNFDTLYHTPEAIDNLKKNILNEAVRGRLVPQEKNHSLDDILSVIDENRQKLSAEGERRIKKKRKPVNEKEIPWTVPDHWKWVRFADFILFIDYRGKTPKKVESGIRLITAKNIKDGFVKFDPKEFIKESEYDKWMTRGIPKTCDLLFTTEAPLGHIAVIDFDFKFALAQRAICFRLLHEGINPYYIMYFMMSNIFKSYLISHSTGMTAKGIKSTLMKKLPFPLPPLEEQHRIVQRIQELFAICDRFKTQLEQREKVNERLVKGLVGEVLGNSSNSKKEEVREEEFLVAAEREENYLSKQQLAFLQILCIAHALYVLKKRNMLQGEMGLAKYVYLMDRIGGINTHFKFDQNNFGPYPSNFRKRLFTRSKYFYKSGSKGYEVIDLTKKSDRLFEKESEQTEQVQTVMESLTDVFELYRKDRAHKLELMASVCWLVEKTNQTNFDVIWKELEEWETPKRDDVDNKAQLFSKDEVEKCLEFILKNGWDKKLVTINE